VAVASLDGTATLWNLKTRRPDHVLTGHTGAISLIAYNPQSTMVATAGGDATVRVWNAASGRQLRILRHPSVAPGVLFNQDGRFLVTTDLAGRGDVWQACPACEDGKALLAQARRRVTRRLTPVERQTYGTG
jgi:WD40 repeat protein